MAERTPTIQPRGWPERLERALHHVANESFVGATVARHIRRRTTLYHGNGNNTVPDSLEAYEGERLDERQAYARASRADVGWAAVVTLVTAQPTRTTGLLRRLEVSLVHELTHAVNITQGSFSAWARHDECEARITGAVSQEEAFAWIVENMYRCEVLGVASSAYTSGGPLARGLVPTSRNTGLELELTERRAVRAVRTGNRSLADALAALPRTPVPYNPFRDHDPSVTAPRRQVCGRIW